MVSAAGIVWGFRMLRREWIVAGLTALIAGTLASAADPAQKTEETITVAAEDITSVTTYAMASPRAFLMGVPVERSDELATIGMAENFPRTDGILEIPTGTRVIFSLSQDTEGVWQQGTYGTIETVLTVQWFQTAATTECDACASENLPDQDGVQTGKGDSGAGPCPWITIATSGARDTRNGPSLGYTKIGIPIDFTLPGTYCVRGIVSTSVKSSYLLSTEPENPTSKEEAATAVSDALLASDTDVVLVKVRVLDSSAKPQGALTADPQVIYTAPMPDMSDTKVSPDEDTKTGDSGAIKLSTGPQTWNVAFAVPSPGVFIGPRELPHAVLF